MPFIIWKNIAQPNIPHDNITRRMRFACWTKKTTDSHSEYVILIVFHSNDGYANAPQYYVYIYIYIYIYIYTYCRSCYSLFSLSLSFFFPSLQLSFFSPPMCPILSPLVPVHRIFHSQLRPHHMPHKQLPCSKQSCFRTDSICRSASHTP